ncbi:MAG: Sin3 associated polypeptide p18-domain-containing protein [Benniella sp.]|nr:MAG: Sin3 associated polypeptide p18-domain-containing protein [Benniella sp.]
MVDDTQVTPAPTGGSNSTDGIDREKLCPFLLRMYYSRGQHHRVDAFSPTSTPPQSSELRLYTWKNATLGEIASLVKQAIPDLVSQAGTGAQLSFRHIYLDINKGIFVGRDVGKVYLDTPQPSPPPPQESVSRLGDIPKDGLFTKDMHQNSSSGNSASIATETGVANDGAGGTGGSAKESAAAPGGHPLPPPPPPGASGSGLKAYEKTLASIKFVIGDYLDIAITHGATSGFSSSPMQRRQYNNSGGGAIRHHHGGHRSGRQGGGGGHNPLGDRLAGRLGGGGSGGGGLGGGTGGGSGGGGVGHSHNGHGQGTNGRRGQLGLDVQNEPSWKSRGRGR